MEIKFNEFYQNGTKFRVAFINGTQFRVNEETNTILLNGYELKCSVKDPLTSMEEMEFVYDIFSISFEKPKFVPVEMSFYEWVAYSLNIIGILEKFTEMIKEIEINVFEKLRNRNNN